jgi:hypothetical protein
VGRFLSVDPIMKQYPMLTPYQFSSNSPIQNIDLDGKEGTRYTINISGQPVVEIVNLKVYVNVTNSTAYANGIFAGAAYQDEAAIVNKFHTYLNDTYNGGKDLMGVVDKPITVNEVSTPVYYKFDIIPIRSASETDFLNHFGNINGAAPDIVDNKTVNGSRTGNDYVFLKFQPAMPPNTAARFAGGSNNEIELDPARFAAGGASFANDVAHEIGHKLLSRHPIAETRSMGKSEIRHNLAGGIFNYNFTIPLVGGGRQTIFDPSKTVTQENTNDILKSVIKLPNVNLKVKTRKEDIPQ